ncbi:MAG: hypothetical protein WD626_01005, partial [Bauldia sp.]
VTVNCTKECFRDGVGLVDTTIEAAAAGNIILGGVIGVGIDAASGAAHKYTPQVNVPMEAIPQCRPRQASLGLDSRLPLS